MAHRIRRHPVLKPADGKEIRFHFNDTPLRAREGEMISSALFANGVKRFGSHPRDSSPQGLFCANGQCGQCLVLVNGVPKKACLTPVEPDMRVKSQEGLPELPDASPPVPGTVETHETEVLIVGAGPAGLAAARELGVAGVSVIVADDKRDPGGKLLLQTHNFFGSRAGCYAGMRGWEIGGTLARDVEEMDSVEIWQDSPVVGVLTQGNLGVVREGRYRLVRPEVLMIATGAREKMLAFPGCDLPGVYGAGAFQTLVNRDMIRAADRIFIVGGGNVGLIVAYQALQAGIDVLGIAEALPRCGGYKVHLDKLKRLGVPIHTSHTVLRVSGEARLERVVIGGIDENFEFVKGTEKVFDADTLLIAVGLSPVNELADRAEKFGIRTYRAGDAEEIAEASAAMYGGRIAGRKIARELGREVMIPDVWGKMLEVLRKGPGPIRKFVGSPSSEASVYPVIRCVEEIPCNPCTEVCPLHSISISKGDIEGTPTFAGECVGCCGCVNICPGLAITLVDKRYDDDGEKALVTVPWEMAEGLISQGTDVVTAGFEGEMIGTGRVVAVKASEWQERRRLVALEVPWDEADEVAGIRIAGGSAGRVLEEGEGEGDKGRKEDDDIIICRCERVAKGEILRVIRAGVKDINDLKARTRIGMGACGGKTCMLLIERLFREEGVDPSTVTPHFLRPFTQEVPLDAFLGEGDPPREEEDGGELGKTGGSERRDGEHVTERKDTSESSHHLDKDGRGDI